MKCVFLDVDGVLNHQHFGKDEQSKFGFDKTCINALKYILIHVPDAKIVITSAWKRFDIEPRVSETIPWRKVLETQLNKPNVIIGDTPYLDGNIPPGCDVAYTRASDIEAYLKEHDGTVEKFVIIDDEVSCYKRTWLEDHVVDCEIKTGRGLDAVNACLAVRILKGTIGPKLEDFQDNVEERSQSFSYDMLFDDACKMADILKRIDMELAHAAQYEDTYKGYMLLLNLCKIMYSCKADYKNKRYN